MPRPSAGLLLFRHRDGRLEVLLVHPGGPLWASRDDGAWMVPKGEIEEGEDPLVAARRELAEETGWSPPGEPLSLGTLRQAGGKLVHAWALRADVEPATLRSGTFAMEWPPRSGRRQQFAEVDRAAWFTLEDARRRILPSQRELLDRLAKLVGDGDPLR